MSDGVDVGYHNFFQAASRQQPPAPVAPRERVKEASIITILDPLIHCLFMSVLHFESIVGSISRPLEHV